jgi:hypothetical protein
VDLSSLPSSPEAPPQLLLDFDSMESIFDTTDGIEPIPPGSMLNVVDPPTSNEPRDPRLGPSSATSSSLQDHSFSTLNSQANNSFQSLVPSERIEEPEVETSIPQIPPLRLYEIVSDDQTENIQLNGRHVNAFEWLNETDPVSPQGLATPALLPLRGHPVQPLDDHSARQQLFDLNPILGEAMLNRVPRLIQKETPLNEPPTDLIETKQPHNASTYQDLLDRYEDLFNRLSTMGISSHKS